jgi:hypothetical protein
MTLMMRRRADIPAAAGGTLGQLIPAVNVAC